MKSLLQIAPKSLRSALEVLKRVKVPESIAPDLTVDQFTYANEDGFSLTLYGSKNDVLRYAFATTGPVLVLYNGNAFRDFKAGHPTTARRTSFESTNELVTHLNSQFRILGLGRTSSFKKYLDEKKAALRRAG